MLLLIRNLKQKQLSKKLSHKFVKLFRVKDKINEQTYRLTLSNIYRIHNTFYVYTFEIIFALRRQFES